MKKFVGLVNGQSFDSEKDWINAAQDAIKNNDGNIAISSYYKYVDEPDEKKVDDKYVSTSEYFLGNRKPENVSKLDSSKLKFSDYTNVEYTVSSELAEKLKGAINVRNIKENIDHHVTKLTNSIKGYREDVQETEKKIDELHKKLYDQQAFLLDLIGRRKYYNSLLDILESTDCDNDCECNHEKLCTCGKEKKCETKVTEDTVKKLLNIDENTTIVSVLKQLGILK